MRELNDTEKLLHRSFGGEKGYNKLCHKKELFQARLFTLEKYGQKLSRSVKKELHDNISWR